MLLQISTNYRTPCRLRYSILRGGSIGADRKSPEFELKFTERVLMAKPLTVAYNGYVYTYESGRSYMHFGLSMAGATYMLFLGWFTRVPRPLPPCSERSKLYCNSPTLRATSSVTSVGFFQASRNAFDMSPDLIAIVNSR